MLKFASFCLIVCLPFVRAEWWDDFSNNLATDLAPFLSLFGERVTMQYLSESITLLDYFIFAMAPMGILTAIVSAIRVCGSPSLRALVGRAQEGGGNAEAELCSSTSRDVCELYNNGGIARVFGRPKILEIIHDPTDPDFSKKAGLYTFQEYTSLDRGKKVWQEQGAKPHGDSEPGGDDGKQPRHMETAAPEPFAPNLSLNVGIKRKPKAVFWAVAIAGAILQAGVMVFAAVVTYYLRWEMEGSSPDGYACPLAVIGTALVCAGIFSCAYLVGESTKERVFRKVKRLKEGDQPKQSPIYWVQPGNQVLGDQTFDPFCFSDCKEPLQEYLVSWKNRSDKPECAVWVVAGITISGFVLQFVGLRGMHAAISVAQLGAILVMSAARASLRMQRLKPEDNFFVNFPDEVVGHEIDWLALRIGRKDIQSDLDSSPSPPSPSPPSPSPPSPSPPSPSPPSPSLSSGVLLERQYYWEFCGMPKNSFKQATTELSSRRSNTATKLLAYRTRLAELTESPKDHPGQVASARYFSIEMVKVRLEAQKLAANIVSAVNIIYSRIKDRAEDECLSWEIKCSVSSRMMAHDHPSKESEHVKVMRRQHAVHLKLCRTIGYPWKLEDPRELEALLGLWVWSLMSDPTMETQDPYSHLTRSRATEVTTQHIIATDKTPKNIGVWLGDANPGFQESTLCPKAENGVGPANVFTRDKNNPSGPENGSGRDYELLEVHLPHDLGPSQRPTAVRFFGWHNVDLSKTQAPQSTTIPLRIFSAGTNSSLLSSCAQEIFGYFIKAILESEYTQEIGHIKIEQDGGGFRLENSLVTEMTKFFTESRLGSRIEALLCILPSVLARLQLPFAKASLEAAKNKAKENRQREQWKHAEAVLRWAWEICRNSDSQGGEMQVQDHTSPAAVALGELYRWALIDEAARTFGKEGIDWLLKERKKCQSEACRKVIDRYNTVRERFDIHHDDTDDGVLPDAKTDLTTTLLRITRGAFSMDRETKGAILVNAARSGWTEVVLALLELAAEPGFKDPSSARTALSYAAEHGMVEIADELIRGGAFPDSEDNSKTTPMMLAACNGHEAVVRLLLKTNKVDVNSQNTKRRMPLHMAVEYGHTAVVNLLVSTNKCDLNHKDDTERGPLLLAAEKGHAAVVKLLLENPKVIPDNADSTGRTPLSWAAEQGHEAIVKLLLKTGKINPDSADLLNRETSLLRAVKQEHEAVVKLLLENPKVNPNNSTSNGRIPLSWAAEQGHEAIVTLLLENPKVNPDIADSNGRTPLSWAAKWGYEAVVKLLLETPKVNPDSISSYGWTPLNWAAEQGNEAIVKLLLENPKVNPDIADSHGRTPLSWAAEQGHEVVVKLLLENPKVNPDIADWNGRTPLSWAAKWGHKAVVKLLLENPKVNPDSKDARNMTPLALAEETRHQAVVKLLKRV